MPTIVTRNSGPGTRAAPVSDSLLNRAACRRFALEYARSIGRGEVIERIGSTVFASLGSLVRTRLRTLVESHPSAFKTLEAFTPERSARKAV